MLSISTCYTLHATRLIAFGIFWFFITLSIESSVIPIRDVINEHRLYLPSVGIIIAFSTAVFYVASRLMPHLSRLSLTTAYSLLTTAVVVLSIATYQRNIVWESEVSLWGDAVVKSPNKARPNYKLGLAYAEQGNKEKAFYYMKKAKQLDASLFKKYLSTSQ